MNNSTLFEKIKSQIINTEEKKEKKPKNYIINVSVITLYTPYEQKLRILKIHIEKKSQLLMSEVEYNYTYTIIKEKITKNKIPVSKPIAITLGGQPGAGKSTLYSIARKRFSKNIVEIDCDYFRQFHPYARQINSIYGNDDVLKTNPFVFKVVDELIEELSDKKYNMIIESSLNKPDSAEYNGKYLPPKGYQVELQVMATNKKISWQSTINRYNKQKKEGKIPRAVAKGFHDTVVGNICKSLDKVKKGGLMSNILIYTREKECIYDMTKDKLKNPASILFIKIN